MTSQYAKTKGSVYAVDGANTLRVLVENTIWIVNNRGHLRKLYPRKYVAVDHGEVVGVSDSMRGLVSVLESKYKDIAHIATDYIGEQEVELILPH